MDRLKDKVIVVTGAAMGQGAEEVRLFVEEGARVIAGDVATEALERVAAEVNALHPGHVLPVKLDVSNGEDWDALVAAGAAQFGKIDGLMNNAGIGTKGVFWEETSYELFKRVIDVNLWGQFRGIQAVVPDLAPFAGASKSAYLDGCLDLLEGAYGSAGGYLRSAGVGQEELESLRAKLLPET